MVTIIKESFKEMKKTTRIYDNKTALELSVEQADIVITDGYVRIICDGWEISASLDY